MPHGGKLCLLMTIGATAPFFGQTPPERPVVPPAIRLPFSAVKADAVFEIPAVVAIGTASGAMWVVGRTPAAAVPLDPATNTAGSAISLPAEPCGTATFDFGALWVPLCTTAAMARIDLEAATMTSVPMPGLSGTASSLATGVGSLWLASDEAGTVLRIDPADASPVADIHVPKGSIALAFGAKALWASGGATGQVVRINPHTNLIEETIAAGKAPRRMAAGDDAVWVLDEGSGTVIRIDPAGNRVAATIDPGVPLAGGSIAAGEESVWVSAPGSPLVRIDPRTNHVMQVFTGEHGGGPIAVAHRSLWMAVDANTVWRIDPRFVAALRYQGLGLRDFKRPSLPGPPSAFRALDLTDPPGLKAPAYNPGTSSAFHAQDLKRFSPRDLKRSPRPGPRVSESFEMTAQHPRVLFVDFRATSAQVHAGVVAGGLGGGDDSLG